VSLEYIHFISVLNSKPLIFVNRLVVIPRGYQIMLGHNSRVGSVRSVLSNQYVDILHNRIQINFYAAHITSTAITPAVEYNDGGLSP
jgi:hypothetical protein